MDNSQKAKQLYINKTLEVEVYEKGNSSITCNANFNEYISC